MVLSSRIIVVMHVQHSKIERHEGVFRENWVKLMWISESTAHMRKAHDLLMGTTKWAGGEEYERMEER